MKPNPFQALPESVEIAGCHIPIDADFRVGVAIETEAMEENPDVVGLLKLFYKGEIPPDVEAAADRMVWFYAHHDGKEETENAEDTKKGRRWYDFGQDADALLASFLDAYGIDLATARLHWWVFRRLMFNLPPETPFMKRVHYRTADLKKLSKSEQKHYKKMRTLYAIKRDAEPAMTVEEREAALKEKMRRRYEEARKQMEKAAP